VAVFAWLKQPAALKMSTTVLSAVRLNSVRILVLKVKSLVD
jgi:hypothetical protein